MAPTGAGGRQMAPKHYTLALAGASWRYLALTGLLPLVLPRMIPVWPVEPSHRSVGQYTLRHGDPGEARARHRDRELLLVGREVRELSPGSSRSGSA